MELNHHQDKKKDATGPECLNSWLGYYVPLSSYYCQKETPMQNQSQNEAKIKKMCQNEAKIKKKCVEKNKVSHNTSSSWKTMQLIFLELIVYLTMLQEFLKKHSSCLKLHTQYWTGSHFCRQLIFHASTTGVTNNFAISTIKKIKKYKSGQV